MFDIVHNNDIGYFDIIRHVSLVVVGISDVLFWFDFITRMLLSCECVVLGFYMNSEKKREEREHTRETREKKRNPQKK